jgi:hypothetical protein
MVAHSNRVTDSKDIHYIYSVKYIEDAEFKLEIPRYSENRTLTIDDRHGIRIIYLQTGNR